MNQLEQLGAILKRFLESDQFWQCEGAYQPVLTLDGELEVSHDEMEIIRRSSKG